MRVLSKILVNIGGGLCCMAFCLTSEVFWWLPCVLLLLGMLLILCGIKCVTREDKQILHKVPAYITVEDDEGNEIELIAPITDFDLVYLDAIRKDDKNGRL